MASDIQRVRDAIAFFCRESIKANGRWSYSQRRPYTGLGVHPSEPHTNDCSSHATLAYFWAKKKTGVPVPDPNLPDYGPYDGYGWTGSLIENPKAGAPYQIGDLALYGDGAGDTEHVTTCYVAGDAYSSVWCSHGSESGPYAVSLRYRSDLIYVVRPVLVPAGGGGSEEDEMGYPDWFWDWNHWYLNTDRDPDKRPAAAPDDIPDWAWDGQEEILKISKKYGMTEGERDWIAWYNDGKKGERPDVYETIPDHWWKDQSFVNHREKVAD